LRLIKKLNNATEKEKKVLLDYEQKTTNNGQGYKTNVVRTSKKVIDK